MRGVKQVLIINNFFSVNRGPCVSMLSPASIRVLNITIYHALCHVLKGMPALRLIDGLVLVCVEQKGKILQ